MIQQVRRLARETGQVLTGGGHHGLDRLLADLLGDPRDPSVEQLGRVRARRLVARPSGPRAAARRERAAGRFPETRGRTGVARRALVAHHVEHRVSVAVHAHLLPRLRVARGLTLAPQPAARTAAVVGLAGVAGALQGFAVGVGEHEDLARERALSDDGDESIVPEAHGLNPMLGLRGSRGRGHLLKISAPARIVKIPWANILRPMRWVASLGALALVMALLHRVTAGGPLEARATLALGFLLLAALVGGDVARRMRLPRILGYLLIGFAVGPVWLRLVRADEVQALQFLADAGLALIALAAGSELTLAALRAGRTALLRLTTGAVAFPFVAVTLVAWSVSPWLPVATHQAWHDRLAVALVLGTLAAAASPAVTMALMGELEARGPFARSLLGVTIAQDLAVGVLFTLVLVVCKPLVSPGAVNLTVAGVGALELVGSLAVGIVLGYLLAQYLRLGQRRTALLLLAAALLTSEIARALHLETGLIARAAGFYLANFSRESERVRSHLKQGPVPAYLVFFTLTGAGLQLGALAQLWPWALLLIGLRIVSLRYGLLWAGRHPDVTPALAREGWLGLISQAGWALALAQLARRAFPGGGVSLETLLGAMVGGHGAGGPICFRQALVRAGEAKQGEGTHGGAAALGGSGGPGGTGVAAGGVWQQQ